VKCNIVWTKEKEVGSNGDVLIAMWDDEKDDDEWCGRHRRRMARASDMGCNLPESAYMHPWVA
jgi:hypothetical protein